MFEFSKTVKVTNKRNVLVQIPKAVVSDWGIEVGDTLSVCYKDKKLTVVPNVQRRSDSSEESEGMARTTGTRRY